MSDLLGLVILIPILILSMAAHEVVHGFVAYRLGDPTAKYAGRLTANPLRHLDPLGTLMFVITYLAGGFIFGWAKPVPVNPYYFRNHQKGMMLVAAAGPLTNLLIAVGLSLPLNFLVRDSSGLVFEVLYLAFQVNVVLGIFNLFPIPPLDGSRIVGGLMSPQAYAKWIELDRYGMLFILLIFFLFRRPFFAILSGAYRLISRLLLPYWT